MTNVSLFCNILFATNVMKELVCKNKLDDELKKKILRKPYTEQIDRLIFLYGVGVLNAEALKNLVLHNDSDFLSEVLALENEVIKNEGSDEADILSYKQLQKIILLCANSKKYDDLTAVSFATALDLVSSSHIFLTDNGFIRCDSELTGFLGDIGEAFGFYDEDSDTIHIEDPQYISAAVVNGYEIQSEQAPIAVNCQHLSCFLKMYDKLYGRDFIIYASENGLPFDENYGDEYEKYLSSVKLCFDFKAYPKKREVCGNKVNYYDYAINSIEENKLVSSELNASDDYTVSIRLDVDEPLQDSELTEKALRKYRSSRQLIENMVIEVTHAGKTDIYYTKTEIFLPLILRNFTNSFLTSTKFGALFRCVRVKRKSSAAAM